MIARAGARRAARGGTRPKAGARSSSVERADRLRREQQETVHTRPPQPPAVIADDGLSVRERQVAARLVRGVAQKAVAYELSLSPATIAYHVKNLARKVGASSSTELVRLLVARRHHGVPPFQVDSASRSLGVSRAEREVLALVLGGMLQAAIAATRGVAHSTVRNQIASAYAKLGVGSRAELAAHHAWLFNTVAATSTTRCEVLGARATVSAMPADR